MKLIILVLLIFLSASPLFAQQPSISYLMCDEAKSQLQIYGSFGIDSGSVSIEDTTLGIVSWSDSLIICDLPDSGKGAGGRVEVQTKHGVSNKRALSIFSLRIDHPSWHWDQPQRSWVMSYARRWVVNWRMDIAPRLGDSVIRFEASKTSTGFFDGGPWPFHDSAEFFDHGLSFWGKVDLKKYQVIFGQEKYKFGVPHDTAYYPHTINFDTTGYISGYRDYFLPSDFGNGTYPVTDSLYAQRILFPPGIKNSVRQSLSSAKEDWVHVVGVVNDAIIFQSETSLGSTSASLYSIDGRLLKRAILDIPSPGKYSFDVKDVHSHFAILVLQASRGVVTKKIVF